MRFVFVFCAFLFGVRIIEAGKVLLAFFMTSLLAAVCDGRTDFMSAVRESPSKG
jgi:hypothetical protein